MERIKERRLAWDKHAKTFLPANQNGKFLRGPVPWDWLAKAAKLPGKALHVGLALWRLSGATKSDTVRLSNVELDAMGVDRNAKSRALKHLEQAGLVRVSQAPGQAPVVTIIKDI
jgi:hypothetical protein